MAAKLTMTAAKTQKNDIAYARVGVYDVEADYKDSFSVDKYVTMYEDKGSAVIISAEWTSGSGANQVVHPRKMVKLEDTTIVVTDGDWVRTYQGLSEESLRTFYDVCKAVKNGSDNFNSISMADKKRPVAA